MENLIFIPKTNFDSNLFEEAIEKSEFFCEQDEGSFFFEEDANSIDELERELQDLLRVNEISGHFEREAQ